MRRPPLLAIATLPLLAVLLMAQGVPAPPTPAAKPATKPAVALPRTKPAALTAQQKKAEAEAQKKAATAAQKKPATAAQPKTTGAIKPAPPANKQEAPKYTLADYYKVWDVTAATTRADIVARFGEPQRVGDSARKPFYYFNDTLTFFFTADDTVSTMIVGNSFEPIAPNTIPPEVVEKAFIGRTRADVEKTFGPANVVSSENYRYFPKAGAYKVEFQCYDIDRYVCKQMLVQF